MIRLTFEDPGAVQGVRHGLRLIAQAVPWNVEGRPRGYPGPVRFAPKAVDLMSMARSPVLLDHDPARPVGIHLAAVNTRTALYATLQLADTEQGRDAYALAVLGARSGVSIGVDAQDYTVDETGVLTVLRASHRETSLLTFPAYASASASPLPEGDPSE